MTSAAAVLEGTAKTVYPGIVLPDGLWRLKDSLLADKDLLLGGERVLCHTM